MASTESLLRVDDLRVTYASRQPGGEDVHAVRGIDLSVERGSVLALVGESGCGKSATAFSLTGLLPANARVEGSATFEDTTSWPSTNVSSAVSGATGSA
ncbi:hypothetical protein GCM10025864_19500 [Luteimicrobium album]|uniref:ABC transporter domain-containing protein n=1 Tax=Luteimicrobium album TaxID=1054550 RepID=A0ABQ6I0B9_9MICO|nr:hypothetical protein GCM10025864_19500 [Luteimicrobium album]